MNLQDIQTRPPTSPEDPTIKLTLAERDGLVARIRELEAEKEKVWRYKCELQEQITNIKAEAFDHVHRADALERVADTTEQQIMDLTEARNAATARAEKAERERDESKEKCKQTARDFETAFRTVREENDRLRASVPDCEAIVRELQADPVIGTSLAVATVLPIIRRHFANAPDATAELRKEVERLKGEKETLIFQYENELDTLRAKLDAAEKERDGLKSTVQWLATPESQQLRTERDAARAALERARAALNTALEKYAGYINHHLNEPTGRPVRAEWYAKELVKFLRTALQPEQFAGSVGIIPTQGGRIPEGQGAACAVGVEAASPATSQPEPRKEGEPCRATEANDQSQVSASKGAADVPAGSCAESDTPLTDAVRQSDNAALRNHARDLERRLAQAERTVASMSDDIADLSQKNGDLIAQRDQLRAALAALRARREGTP